MLPPYPIHYRNRIAEIEAALEQLPPDIPTTLVLLGDSISEWHPARKIRGLPVFNMGISGDQADHPQGGMLARVPLVPGARPAEVWMLVGINDLANAKPPQELARQQEAVIRALLAAVPLARVYVQSVMPTSGNYLNLLPAVQESNRLLRAIAERLNLPYLDLASAMADASGQMREELTNDGVHLTPAGYQLWTTLLDSFQPKTC